LIAALYMIAPTNNNRDHCREFCIQASIAHQGDHLS